MFDSIKLSGKLYPTAFIGHGSPMNAVEDNEYSQSWRKLGEILPAPQAIVVVSAHWETSGTRITANEQQKTIHDFYGFPDALYKIQYNAPGSPHIVKLIASQIPEIHPDNSWGLDHGTWSILVHLFPGAKIPVLQISLNTKFTPEQHYETGQKLSFLREHGVFLVSSGNMIHNLQMYDWQNSGRKYDWAEKINTEQVRCITDNDFKPMISYQKHFENFRNAIPTPEHYLPALYTLGARKNSDRVTVFNNTVNSSLSMTSFLFWQ